MKLISAGQIDYGVYFQFKEGGKVCCANHSYISNGYKFTYFMNNGRKCAKYKTTERANKRMLILREDINASARQRNRLKIIEA